MRVKKQTVLLIFEKIRENEDLQLENNSDIKIELRMKTEAKEETIEDFDASEQIRIDFITSKDSAIIKEMT